MVIGAIFASSVIFKAATEGLPWLFRKADLSWWHWLMLIGMLVLTVVGMSIVTAIDNLRKSSEALLEDQRQREVQTNAEVISALLDIARNTEK